MRRVWLLIAAVLLLAIGFAGGALATGSNSSSSTAVATVHCVVGPGSAPCELAETAELKRVCRAGIDQVKLSTIIEDTYRGVTSRTTNIYPC